MSFRIVLENGEEVEVVETTEEEEEVTEEETTEVEEQAAVTWIKDNPVLTASFAVGIVALVLALYVALKPKFKKKRGRK